MPKTSAKKIFSEIGSELLFYLRNGHLRSITNSLELNLRNPDFKKLLKIQFLLQEDTQSFLKDIRYNSYRLFHSTQGEISKSESMITGKVLWDKTLKEFAKTGFTRKNQFIVKSPAKIFDVNENLVLMNLLQEIELCFNLIEYPLKKNYDWVSDLQENNLLTEFLFVYKKNPYLSNLRSKKIAISTRNIRKVLKSRKVLYRDAAKLLLKIKKLNNCNIDLNDLKRFIEFYIVKPKPAVLFELYWIIRLLRIAKELTDFIPKIQLGGETNLIASWKNKNWNFKLYHNSTGSVLSFTIKENLQYILEQFQEFDPHFFYRNYSIAKEKAIIVNKIIEQSDRKQNRITLWKGTPDVLIEAINTITGEHKFIVGEVKYSQDKQYILDGLNQLVQYMSLSKLQNDYVFADNTLLSQSKILGILFIDNTEEFDTSSINRGLSENGINLRIYQVTDQIESFILEYFNDPVQFN